MIIDDPNFTPLNMTRKIPPQLLPGKEIKWENDNWIFEDIPLQQLTPEQKLLNAGLTIEELKALLGLQ